MFTFRDIIYSVIIMNEFKDMLVFLRKREGLSQFELGEKLGLTKSTISMYENGRRKPSFEALEAIADFFNVSINFLMGKNDSDISGQYIQSHQYNIVKIASRDGSYQEKRLSDEDLAVITRIIDTLPDASDDL